MLDPSARMEPAARQNYDDTWSPAITQHGRPLHYWPNITCATRAAAIARAEESINNLESAEEVLEWNVWPDTMAEGE